MNFDDIFNNSFEKKMIDENVIKEKVNSCRSLILEKFGDIKFEEEGHKYTIDGQEYMVPLRGGSIRRRDPMEKQQADRERKKAI